MENFIFCAVLHLRTVQPVQPSWTSNWPEIKEQEQFFTENMKNSQLGNFNRSCMPCCVIYGGPIVA